MKKIRFIALALLLFLNFFTVSSAQDLYRTGDINTRLQELSQQIEGCGSDFNCKMKILQEIQALFQEHQGINNAQGQGMSQVPGQMKMGIPSCVGQVMPGWSCLPVRMTVSDKTNRRMFSEYCRDPGVIPCGKEWYLADDFTFEYTSKGNGILNYTHDFEEFEIWARSVPEDNKVMTLYENSRWQEQSFINGIPVEKWMTRSGPAGTVSVANTPSFAVKYPDTEAATTNINFDGLSVVSTDPEMPEAYGSMIYSGDTIINYMMTPDIVKTLVASGRLSKKFYWRDNAPDGKSYTEHTVDITLEVDAPAPEKPGALVVSPGSGFISNRPDPKMPFSPLSKTYTLKNTGDKTINFSIAKTVDWLRLDKIGGSLPPGGSTTLVVSINVPVADKLAEDTYKDTLTFKNTTDGKGNTTRPAQVSLAEEQTWRVLLSGQETDDIGGKVMYLKINTLWKNKVVEYGVRFTHKMTAEFILMKKKGKWIYKTGKITSAKVSAIPVFDPNVFIVKSYTCKNCSQIGKLVGAGLGGEVVGDTVRLLWPDFDANATVLNKLKLEWIAKDESHKESMKGFSNNEFFAESFFDSTKKHYLPLKDGEVKPFAEHRHSSADQYRQKGKQPINLYHRYVLKRLK